MYDVWKAVKMLDDIQGMPLLFQESIDSARRQLAGVDGAEIGRRMFYLRNARANVDQLSKLSIIKKKYPMAVKKLEQIRGMIDDFITDEMVTNPEGAKKKWSPFKPGVVPSSRMRARKKQSMGESMLDRAMRSIRG